MDQFVIQQQVVQVLPKVQVEQRVTFELMMKKTGEKANKDSRLPPKPREESEQDY